MSVTLEEYSRNCPATFEEFYNQAINKSPFDLDWNQRGFNHRSHGNDFNWSCQSALMPTMVLLGSLAEVVIQTGEREGYSGAAFAKGLSLNGKERKELYVIDATRQPIQDKFDTYTFPCKRTFINRNVLEIQLPKELPECDVMFIDTLHEANHVWSELHNLAPLCKKYLVFHDTVSQGQYSLDTNTPLGINMAIDKYTEENGFEFISELFFNHGMRIYKRK